MSSDAKFTKQDTPELSDRDASTAKWYRSIVASCNYICMWTRPDIAYAVSKLAKYMANPGKKHVEMLKRLLRYLKGTVSHGLVYDFSAQPPLAKVYGYYDASHADDLDTRRSTMGFLFFYEGCVIAWSSKLHTYATTSTNHSEYCASAKCARMARYLEKNFKRLLK